MRAFIISVALLIHFFLIVKEKKLNAQNPSSYSYVREADMMWSKHIWRAIDLREKINLPLYYPLNELPERSSLFRIIQKGIYSGEISNIYEYDVFTNEFGRPLQLTEIKKAMTELLDVKDSIGEPLLDALGNQVTFRDTLKPDRIVQYWLKEEWFFDKQRSVLEVRIIGIAPVIEVGDPSTDRFGYKPLFWIYFPGCRNYFSKNKCYNPSNDAQWISFDDLFCKRIFSSYILQESNVYGRSIASYAQGDEALLESERIKEDVFKFEENLWHY